MFYKKFLCSLPPRQMLQWPAFPIYYDNFCREHSLITSLLMWGSSHLQGKQFPITCINTTYFHMHISISQLSSHYVVGYQVVQSLTVRSTVKKNIQFLATSLFTYSIASQLTIIKKTSSNHFTNRYWVSSSAFPY